MADEASAKKHEPEEASERRTCHRQMVSCRSAIWFDEGPKQGVLGTISDISTGGFSATLHGAPADAFARNSAVYCVLLVQNAHIGCMATPIAMTPKENGIIQIGFRFEALSDHEARLLGGVLQFLANSRNEAGEPVCSKDPEVVCNPSRCRDLWGEE